MSIGTSTGRPSVTGLALSGKRVLLGLLAAAGTLAAACGGEATAATPVAASASATATATATTTNGEAVGTARVGKPLTASAATAFLPMEEDGWQYRPVASIGGRVLVQAAPVGNGDGSSRFLLWDPVTDDRTPAWESPTGKQEIVTGVDGTRVAVVRTGFALPFPDWELLVRDVADGTERLVAASTPGTADIPGLEPGLPLGFAPWGSISGNHVAWAEYIPGDDGKGSRRVRLFDLDTGTGATLAEVPATGGETLESPTLGGGRAAWIHATGGKAEFVIADLPAGTERHLPVDGLPFMAALSADGTHLAWDDRMTEKFAMDLADGSVVRYAGSEGWGVMVSDGRFSWAPAAAFGGKGGFFDASSGTVRMLSPAPGTVTNLAQVMGDWFAWQELPAGEGGAARGRFVFVPLGI